MNMNKFRPMHNKKKSSRVDVTDPILVSSVQTFNRYVGYTRFELKYMTGRPVEYFLSRGEGLPSTCAMAWCMRETEMARIFTHEDMYEFLFRLQILFQGSDLVESWLTEGSLVSYTFKGEPYVLTLEDIVMHFGFEAYDHYINHTARKRFLERLQASANFAMTVGYNTYFPDLRMQEHRRIESNFIYAPEITPEKIARAEFLATDIMKAIPVETFTKKSRPFLEKERELEVRHQRILGMESFPVRKIPEETIRKCLQTIYTDDFVDHILSAPEIFEAEGRKIIYVAWVYAKCFMKPDGTFTREKGTFICDFMDFELDGGGYYATGRCNITYNIEFVCMDGMVRYLERVEL